MSFLAGNTQDGFGEHRYKKYPMCTIKYTAVFLMLWAYISAGGPGHLFFVINIFFFFFTHNTTQHPKYNKTKQQTQTQHLKVQSKGRERGKDNKNTEVTPLNNHVYQTKTLPSINGRRPGPTNSRHCTFTSHYLQEAMDPICFSTHVWCKPVLYYCLLRSCKTSKQHSLLHGTYTETRIIIKKTQTWVNRPINL